MSLWDVWCKPCTNLASTLTLSPNGPKRDYTWPTSPRSSIRCVKNDFWARVTFGANRAPILLKLSTISKRTESSMHLSLVTLEYHRMCPKWFLSQWYVWRKPCTYLASRLPLSPNGVNRASTWASSPWSTTGCVQNNFWAYGIFGGNRALILRQDYHYLQTDWTDLALEFVTKQYHRVCPKRFLSQWYVWRKPCTYLALTLTLSPNGPKKIPQDPHHLVVPSGVSKMIFEPLVRSVQTVHLSCVKITTTSKQTNLSFHLSLVT
jgi:hypothetical protein